jgi:hypothetical protein
MHDKDKPLTRNTGQLSGKMTNRSRPRFIIATLLPTNSPPMPCSKNQAEFEIMTLPLIQMARNEAVMYACQIDALPHPASCTCAASSPFIFHIN